jgi:hypothetical protein
LHTITLFVILLPLAEVQDSLQFLAFLFCSRLLLCLLLGWS